MKKIITICVLLIITITVRAQVVQDTVAPVKKGPPPPHYVGELFGGGVVYYVTQDASGVEHGLIVDLADLSDAQMWSNIPTQIGNLAQSTFNGKINTQAIIAQEGHTTSAALLCDTSTRDGFDDWYLPSMQELNMLWNNLGTINKVLNNDNNPATTALDAVIYWSSTEDDGSTFAWYFGMYDGGPDGDTAGTTYKSETYHVRAIRSF